MQQGTEMGMIKSYYHDEVCALKESDDSFSRDYKAELDQDHEWQEWLTANTTGEDDGYGNDRV